MGALPILDKHPCGCDHLTQSCRQCYGRLSPTTEAAISGRIQYLIGQGQIEEADAASERRAKLRAEYLSHGFRPAPKELSRG